MENSKQEPEKIDVYKKYHPRIVEVWETVKKEPKGSSRVSVTVTRRLAPGAGR